MTHTNLFTRRLLIVTLLGTGAALLAPAPAYAQDGELAELKKRFKERFSALERAKSEGLIGETYEGQVEAVNPPIKDSDLRQTVAAENADRIKLYAIIAKKENTTPDKVAERNALRHRKDLKPGEYYKTDKGWMQKK